jgi:hypothetical protein
MFKAPAKAEVATKDPAKAVNPSFFKFVIIDSYLLFL